MKQSSPHRRRHSGVFARRTLSRCAFLLVIALLGVGCSTTTVTTGGDLSESGASAAAPVSDEASAATPDATSSESLASSPGDAAATGGAPATVTPMPEPTPTPHPIALADTALPRAPIGFDSLLDAQPAGPQPVSIEIEDIDVRNATVIPVGVNAQDLSFEVPPADQVGWYEYGPAPGQAGSAVLAAHIAYNGEDGVFRYLENVDIGAVVVVGFDDGTSRRYQIEAVTEYDKEALPDSVWAREGREQLALITCGGAFNYDLDSYESNTVAIAVPI